MKPLSLLTAALVVTGGITTLSVDRYPLLGGTLIPRGRGNDALEPHKGGSRGGLNRDKADPPYSRCHLT